MPRSRRARCNKWRTRTSSQSSVEIQVTENVVTTSSSVDNPAVVRAKDTVAASSPLPLVRPVPGFLRLIQTVGAQGTSTLHGELFTIKQLCFYLTSYVKHRQLWDPLNPLVVHCDTDPLGQVFQVDRFTLHDAIGLIKRSVVEIDNQGWTKPTGLPRGCTTADQGRDVPHTITSAVGNPPPSTPLRSAPSDNKDAIVSPSTSFARSNADEDVADGKCGKTRKMRKRRKRKRNADKNVSSASSDGGPAKVCRRRQPSFSITYSSDLGEGSHPWQFQVEMYDSDNSEVLSIQSKVTAVVKSSSDDMWFLEESDDISVELNHSFLSAKEADPPFAVEYEVDSDSDASFDDTGSESPVENIFVVCDESDIAFWADSESDNEDRSDEDIVEADKWRCCKCDTINNPLHRYCDRCWKLRPGWLPEQLLSLQQKGMPSLSCSCTSWSQDHKNHIASARTQAWAERVNKSLSCQELAESVAPSNTGSLAADVCQDTTAVSEAQLVVDTVSLDTTSSCVGDNVLQETCQVTSAVPSSIQVSQSDTSLDIGQTNLSKLPPVGSSIAHHEHSDTNTSDTGSIPSNTHFSVNLRHCDTMPIMDSLAQQQSANFFGDSLRTSSVVSADSVDTDSLVTSVTRDDSGIGLGLCSHIPDCDDLAMADIYKHGPREMSTPTTPRQVTTECVTSDSLGASFDVLNHPSTPVKNTVTSTSNTLQSSDVCVICLTRPKEASIIHGNTGHQVCCYVCAKRLRHRRMPCPVCRRPISGVIKNYIL